MCTFKSCEWCDGDTEELGCDWAGFKLLHCLKCSHEFLDAEDGDDEDEDQTNNHS